MRIIPYIIIETSVYITDGANDALIYTFHNHETAEVVCKLLNDAYNGAYQDGYNASMNEKYSNLVEKVTSLKMQNYQLKKKLNQITEE